MWAYFASPSCHNSYRVSLRQTDIRSVYRHNCYALCQSFFGVQTFHIAVLQFHRGKWDGMTQRCCTQFVISTQNFIVSGAGLFYCVLVDRPVCIIRIIECK